MIPIINTIATITGRTKVRYPLVHRGSLGPFPVLASLKKLFQPHPLFNTQKKRMTSEPSGRIRLLTRKSSKSRIPLVPPIGWIPDKTLNPSAHGKARANIIIIFK